MWKNYIYNKKFKKGESLCEKVKGVDLFFLFCVYGDVVILKGLIMYVFLWCGIRGSCVCVLEVFVREWL